MKNVLKSINDSVRGVAKPRNDSTERVIVRRVAKPRNDSTGAIS